MLVAFVTVYAVPISVYWKNNGSQELDIASPNDLDSEELEVYDAFSEYINDDVNRAVTEYARLDETEDGRLCDTDSARKLSSYYEDDPIAWTDAVHEPASALVKEVFRRRMKFSTRSGEEDRDSQFVTILGGGPGSGKTYATRRIAGANSLARAHTVFDTTLASIDSARSKIERARTNRGAVLVLYVHCDIETAMRRVYERALRSGRIVRTDVMAACHIGARSSIRTLLREYRSSEQVGFRFLENTGGTVDVASDINKISIDFTLTEQDALEKAREVVEHEHEQFKGKPVAYSNKRVYRALLGSD